MRHFYKDIFIIILFNFIYTSDTYVRHSDKSNEMSEKIKIELALVYYCPVHDQSGIFSILPIDKLVDFFMIFQSSLSYKEI